MIYALWVLLRHFALTGRWKMSRPLVYLALPGPDTDRRLGDERSFLAAHWWNGSEWVRRGWWARPYRGQIECDQREYE